MRQLARLSLIAVATLALATFTESGARAQATRKAAGTQAPATGKAASTPATAPAPGGRAPSPNDVVATVNGDKVTRGEVVQYLGQYRIPPNITQEDAYSLAVNALINTKLLTQFLVKQNVPVTEDEVKEQLAQIEKDVKDNQGKTLATVMAETGTSMSDLRDKIAQRLKWRNFVKARATDQALKKYAEDHKDELSDTQVRASHILISVPPNAPEADKTKAREKLEGIRRDIEGGKISFAEAANKYSEDPVNVQTKSGGDLNFFPRRGHFIEPFSAAAFALKKGEISQPVETQFGYHLIQVTDRREGQPINFEQMRDAILNAFAADLQERVIAEGRKTAKIDIKPMPDDLFQAPPAQATPGAAPAAPGTAPARTPAPAPATPKAKAAAPR